MRNIVVFILVTAVCIAGLGWAEIGVLGYVWFGLMRPDYMAYSPGARYSMALAICALVGCLRYLYRIPFILKNRLALAFLIFQIPILISTVFAQQRELSMVKYIPFLQMSLMVLLIPLVIVDYQRLKWLFFVMAFSLGLVGFKFGLWGVLMGGVSFHEGVGGFHADNNTMAVGLVMSLPLCWYSIKLCTQPWAKFFYSVLVFCSIAAIVMTHSRGGFLSLAAVLMMVILRSKHKSRITIALLILIAPSVLLVWDSYVARLSTLENPLEEGSAAGRYQLNVAAVKMIRDYPIMGVGFGADNFAALSSEYLGFIDQKRHVVHNNYLQMWVDSGILAIVIFCGMLFGSILWLGRAYRKHKTTNPEWAAISSGLQLSLIGFAVGSTFVSRTNYDFIYILLVAVGCWHQVLQSISSTVPAADTITNVPAQPVLAGAPAVEAIQKIARPAEPWVRRSPGLGRALRDAGRRQDAG